MPRWFLFLPFLSGELSLWCGERFAGQTGFSGYADREGFMAVYPDGIRHNWNDGRDTTDAYKAGVDDVKFIRALVARMQSKFSVDAKRIYATGVSI